jgi:hypothetical protein
MTCWFFSKRMKPTHGEKKGTTPLMMIFCERVRRLFSGNPETKSQIAKKERIAKNFRVEFSRACSKIPLRAAHTPARTGVLGEITNHDNENSQKERVGSREPQSSESH